jgi:hypothetical protein
VGLEMDQVRQVKQLQEENTRWKQVVADLTLEFATATEFSLQSRPSVGEALSIDSPP